MKDENRTSATADNMILFEDETGMLFDLSELIDGPDDPLYQEIFGDDDGE